MLLQRLNKEVFILDLRQPLSDCPVIDGYVVRLIDDHCLEVEIEKHQSLNQVFQHLQQAGIEVVSMRNKVNRLEELFVSLVENKAEQTDKQESAR